jgi:hypothetical protein
VCGRDVLIYAEEETVTRVLYALCQESLGRGGYEERLLQTFDEPSIVRHHHELAATYDAGYRRYRAFAEFAYERANAVFKGEAKAAP